MTGIQFHVQTGSGIHSSSHLMDTGCKAAIVCSWPLTSIKCQGSESSQLYLHSYICMSWCLKHRNIITFF